MMQRHLPLAQRCANTHDPCVCVSEQPPKEWGAETGNDKTARRRSVCLDTHGETSGFFLSTLLCSTSTLLVELLVVRQLYKHFASTFRGGVDG